MRKGTSIAIFYALMGAVLLSVTSCYGQPIVVKELVRNINASGGVTTDQEGNVYISDYGPKLGFQENPTNVYKWDVKTSKVSIFASGFKGASGSCFDNDGNFYQSNPSGNSISKITPDGNVQHNWVAENLKLPVGLEMDNDNNLFVCNCGKNTIGRISSNGEYKDFAVSELFKCPNGLTKDEVGNLYACNFSDGKVIKIDRNGSVSVFAELPTLSGGPNLVGNGHLIWKNGFLYVTTIGTGELFEVNKNGYPKKIAGIPFTFKNSEGDAKKATFNKPNGIAASITGDTLYINVSDPTWTVDPQDLHPAHLYMVSGIKSAIKSNQK